MYDCRRLAVCLAMRVAESLVSNALVHLLRGTLNPP